MVNFPDTQLNRTFSALADPTRRALLARLEQEPGLSISELARPLAIKLPAVMKHLDVLADAGLVERRKTGRTVTVTVNATPLEEATQWLKRYERFWSDRLDRLVAFAEEQETKTG
jgi:DNA-binding transcriptional ArsR family regulator